MTNLFRKRLLASTTFVGAALMSTSALAQAQESTGTPETASSQSLESSDGTPAQDRAGADVVVTGSRIPQQILQSASPVTFVGAADIRSTGVTRVEDLLNQLPQVFADQGANISNGATGTATIDLRGLGSSRTLALINGRRIVPGDPASNDSAADINLIPAQLIKRVDIFTGGASSVYGADAVAGVVNFVMDTDFTGFKVDAQYSFFNHNNRADSNVLGALGAKGFGAPDGVVTDGGALDASIAFGASTGDGHGHITAYGTYRRIEAVVQADRDYSSCTLQSLSPANVALRGRNYNCGGSPTAFPANFYTGGGYVDNQGRANPGGYIYNYAPTNYYQRPDERYTAGLFANYEVSNAFNPYFEFMFMDDLSVAQIAPSGDFFNTSTLNCDNPLASAGLLAAIGCTGPTGTGNVYIGRRNVEGGGRRDVLRHTTYRFVTGAKGEIAKGISYDAYYQYGRVNASDQQENQISVSKLKNALDVVLVDGVAQCRSATAVAAGCVPYNIFQPGGVTQAALNYLSIPTFSSGQNSEQVFNTSVTFLGSEYGVASPLATGGVALNVGFEYRSEANTQNYDVSFSSGDIAGAGSAPQPISGRFKVTEGFAELSIPLIEERPFFQQLKVTGGYRHSHYVIGDDLSSFNTSTYKGEVLWQPIHDLKLRGTYNRAVRAPNVGELFLAQQVALDGTSDPCARASGTEFNGTTVNGYTQAQCALTGLSAAQFGNLLANSAAQYNGLVGGNPSLKPEVADSYTGGIVLTPSFLPRFSLTVDYFNIKIKDNIGRIGADTIITQCLQTGSAAFCDLVHRDANGSLFRTNDGYIIDTVLNQGSQKTSGIDVTLNYTQELGGYGTLAFNGVGTWLKELTYEPVAGLSYNCSGLFGSQCGTPNPEWRHRVGVTYTAPSGPSVTVRWRYFSKVKNDQLAGDTDLNPPGSAGSGKYAGSAGFGAVNYFDLSMTAPIADKFTFRLGANNVLDKSPPLNGQGLGNGNTYSQVYDALGRYVYAGITLDF